MRDLSKIKPEDYYRELGGKLKTEPETGDITFNTLEEWYNYPYKYDIMIEVYNFMNSLHKLSNFKLKYLYGVGRYVGMFPKDLILPFYYNGITPSTINRLIDEIGTAIHGEGVSNVSMPLVNTNLGYTLYNELCNIDLKSNLVFCHNYLCYKSFIVKENKLVGIRNWEYAGYYPSEFENITQKYLEFI